MNKMLLLGSILVLICFANDYTKQVEKKTVQVTVKEGDTLWWLVSDEMTKMGDRRDIRKVIYETSELNAMKKQSLQVGDVILIPLEVEK